MTKVHEDFVSPFNLEVFYEDRNYRLVVTDTTNGKSIERTVTCTYEPRFGVDAGDMNVLLAEAEEMCVELESSKS